MGVKRNINSGEFDVLGRPIMVSKLGNESNSEVKMSQISSDYDDDIDMIEEEERSEREDDLLFSPEGLEYVNRKLFSDMEKPTCWDEFEDSYEHTLALANDTGSFDVFTHDSGDVEFNDEGSDDWIEYIRDGMLAEYATWLHREGYVGNG